MKKYLLLSFVLTPLFLFNVCKAQQSSAQINNYYKHLRENFNADNAFQTVAYVEQRWRLAGNTGFNESIYYVENILQKAGYKKEVAGEQDAVLTYRIEKRPMKRPTWEPVDATVKIIGEDEPLLEFKTNRNMMAIGSASTPDGGIEGEVIYINKQSKKELENINMEGKIVFAEGYIGSIYQEAMKKGAAGVICYALPDYNQPSKHTTSIQFTGIFNKDSANQKWGILLSFGAKERLKAAVQKGPVKLKVMTKTKIYPSEELTIVANVRGSQFPDQRFVFSAHVQEPGANDNASGVGTLAEMARVTAQLVQANKIKPERTITFLWGDEIISTDRYIRDDSIRAKGILWGMSLDMVGEDTKKTGGTFLIEKMPDPSAVWTRGDEKHSEWGGSELKESQIVPHYFNDFVLNRCLDQAKQNGWIVKTNPFEGGSDHTPFLNAGKPGLLMWHFTDVYYHTDNDRLDMVSAEEMKNVGISALASAYTLVSADQKTTLFLIEEMKKVAIKRLDVELALSKQALKDKSSLDKEQHILEVWATYYKDVVGKMTDINCKGADSKIMQAIDKTQQAIISAKDKCIAQLKGE